MNRTTDASATTMIDRPASEVFAYVLDVTNDARWRTGVGEAGFTSDGPLGVGSTGFDRVVANGRDVTVTWTVCEFEPGVLVRWNLDSGPIAGIGGYICEQYDDHQTRFTLESHVRPNGWYRLLGPVFGWVGRRQNRADVEELKAIMEGQSKGDSYPEGAHI